MKKLDFRVGRCKLHHEDVRYCGNTTNLHRHLKDKHVEAYNERLQEAIWSDRHSTSTDDDN